MDHRVECDDVCLPDSRDGSAAAQDFECAEVIESDPFEDVVTEEIVLLDLMRLELTDIEVL